MRYWDTSALVPLLVSETTSPEVRAWLHEDPRIVTWAWTRVELTGAIERRARSGQVSRLERRQLLDRVGELAASWDEVVDLMAVRTQASSLLARHDLRAADAAQLAAALLTAAGQPASLTFICLDARLNLAAESEGLRVPNR